MKLREINERPEWTFWVPDSIADWDAPSHWERERLASMRAGIKPGDVLYDVGTEHGWLTAIYGGFGGYENVVLIEPSPEFWPNIKKTWQANGFPGPLGCYQAFAGAEVRGEPVNDVWPACSEGEEVGGMAFRYMNQHLDIPTATIDWIAEDLGRGPDAISIDVEGAELLVLQGASSVLELHRPMVWVSIHEDLMLRDFNSYPHELHGHMAAHEYVGQYIHTDHEAHFCFLPQEATRRDN
jgi:FkbM family methyltransferase